MKLTKEELDKIKKLLGNEEDATYALDEMVHDTYSGMASDKNNEGTDAQIKFLAEGFTGFKSLLEYMGLEE